MTDKTDEAIQYLENALSDLKARELKAREQALVHNTRADAYQGMHIRMAGQLDRMKNVRDSES